MQIITILSTDKYYDRASSYMTELTKMSGLGHCLQRARPPWQRHSHHSAYTTATTQHKHSARDKRDATQRLGRDERNRGGGPQSRRHHVEVEQQQPTTRSRGQLLKLACEQRRLEESWDPKNPPAEAEAPRPRRVSPAPRAARAQEVSLGRPPPIWSDSS